MTGVVLQFVVYGELGICWIAWLAAFAKPAGRLRGQTRIERAPGARLGMVLNILAFACLWVPFRPQGFVKTIPELAASMLLGPLSALLAWKAVRHLGRQWHFEAVLYENHVLVKTGPYSQIRHPIYLSMLGMLLATGLGCTWWPLLVVGLFLLVVGIEIRIQAEDKLLEMYFQDEFIEYRARVLGYIPFLR
jgi:protein-S-isoprenylcysteine O-methyltransferase Ste14